MDYHQSEDGKVKQWDVSYNKAEAEDRGGGELANEGPSPVLRCWCFPLIVLLVDHFLIPSFDLYTPLEFPISLPLVLI